MQASRSSPGSTIFRKKSIAPGSNHNEHFYTRLPVNEIPLAELLGESHLFYRVPDSWQVVITDVKGSTRAVEEGRHENINLVATGSIVAVLNIAYAHSLSVPFFFGGDGATFVLPQTILEEVIRSLLVHRRNTMNGFGLDLRVGSVPVSDIHSAGCNLSITKMRASNRFIIPVVLGDGLHYAENVIKKDDYVLHREAPSLADLDLSGMQCRWDRIRPPLNFDEVVSLVVTAPNPAQQAASFGRVISLIDGIYGDQSTRKPITVSRLKLKATLGKIASEMKARFGRRKTVYLLKTWFTSLLGTFYFRTGAGRTYLVNLVEMSDTLVIDGRINTVISGTRAQREKLLQALDELEAGGQILYGLHVSAESVMSCYVKDLREDHVHFVDGADGGYTRAARQLKHKLLARPGRNAAS